MSGKHAYVIHPGTFDVMVGSASDDIRQKGSFEVTSAGEWPPSDADDADLLTATTRRGQIR